MIEKHETRYYEKLKPAFNGFIRFNLIQKIYEQATQAEGELELFWRTLQEINPNFACYFSNYLEQLKSHTSTARSRKFPSVSIDDLLMGLSINEEE